MIKIGCTYLPLRNSRDFAINGLAVTLDTVNKLSLSSSSISAVRLLPISSRKTDFVDRFCCHRPFASPGPVAISLVTLIESAICTCGAEWIEHSDPIVLTSLNTATSGGTVGKSHCCLIDDELESCILNADDWNFSSNVSRVA